MALVYLSVQGLKTQGAAVLSLGRFGCRGQGFPRMRAKQDSHQTPMGEEQIQWSSVSLVPMTSLFKFESIFSHTSVKKPSSPSQGHQTHPKRI